MYASGDCDILCGQYTGDSCLSAPDSKTVQNKIKQRLIGRFTGFMSCDERRVALVFRFD
jgi:hypothetical protein